MIWIKREKSEKKIFRKFLSDFFFVIFQKRNIIKIETDEKIFTTGILQKN